MASHIDGDLYSLMNNSFQDLISNGSIIAAKSAQINQNAAEEAEKGAEGDWEYIGDKGKVKRFKRIQPSNPNIITIGGIGIVDTPPKVTQ